MSQFLGEFEQLVLLAILRLGAGAYGVTVMGEIERRTGRRVAMGAVYTTLARLEAKGYVAFRLGDSLPERGGRRRKLYRLEPAGAAALDRSFEMLAGMMEGLPRKGEAW